ncbi:MAG: NAD(P)H-quinone oxidoreductase [Chloroflexota bacterium]|jgi:tumor protein p53-inducible protein 3
MVSIPEAMRAVDFTPPAQATDLRIVNLPTPTPRDGELLVKVAATALNRADLLQRRGGYPPPAGASPILGLEVVGTVVHPAGTWVVGDRVMAVVTGGGYAEYACVPANEAMAVPDGMRSTDAAAIPEAFLTAWLNLITLGNLIAGESIFIHAGASGVGSAAIQLAKQWGARVLTAASNDEKRALCAQLGADMVRDSRGGPHAEAVRQATAGHGVNVVLDMLGAPAWADNCTMMANGGRMLLLGFLMGSKGEIDLGPVLTRSLTIKGTTLRRTPAAQKAALVAEASAWLLPRFSSGAVVPVVDRVFAFEDVVAAHQHMEANANAGKIILQIC